MAATIFLFDIDGTILESGHAGRKAMEAAFARVTGDDQVLSRIRFSGMTDRAIVRAGLQALGATQDEETIDAVLEHYLQRLPEEIAKANPYGLHHGVQDAIDCALGVAQAAVGLGTGNIRRGAQCKLEPLGIYESFAFGGFGCDAEDRAELLQIGASRGAQQLGRAVQECRVLVVGDTPKDVDAAHAIGAVCLAVGTGTYTVAQLRETAADHVVSDLSDPSVAALLRGD